MNRVYFKNNIRAAFAGLTFDNSVAEPIKVTMRLEKTKSFFLYEYLYTVVCLYDVHTKKAWLDDETACSSKIKDYDISDSLCAFVKAHMDAVFSENHESENHLLEILCMGEGIVLGEHAMFFKSRQYGLSYEEGKYVLEIPKYGMGLSADNEKKLNHWISNSVLQTELARWLYYLTLKDASFLNQQYMVRREPGKRSGTKVVRNCQEKLLAALNQAEKCISVVNAYREAM